MKKFIAVFLSFQTLLASASGLDYFDPKNGHLCWVYQQQEYKIDDPEGDALLIFSLSQIPQFVKNSIAKKKAELDQFREDQVNHLLKLYPEFYVAPEDKLNPVIEDYVTIRSSDEPIVLEGHKAPFNSKTLALMLSHVIVDEYSKSGLTPKEGTFHRWSQDPRLQARLRKANVFGFTKLLTALSRGVTSRHMITGKEDELTRYIVSRPVNSITLEEMFRSSYLINSGDVYLTLLTIENVLSKNWTHPHRNKLTVTSRLKDITNFNYQTDKFGSWYHLFGIMLFGYVQGGLMASIVGDVESFGSAILSRFEDEKQEDFINSRGGRVGAKLRDFIKSKKFHTTQLNVEYLREDFYLNLNEDFSKRIDKQRRKAKD